MFTQGKISCYLVCLFLISINALAGKYVMSVEVDKVVYQPGAKCNADIRIKIPSEQFGKFTVKVRLEYGLEKRLELPAQSFTLEQKKSIKKAAKAQDDWWDNASGAYLKKDIKISFTVPNEDWGYAVKADLLKDDKVLASAHDEFAVGTDTYRLGQANCYGGGLPDNQTHLQQYAGRKAFWPAKWLKTKGTYLEIMCGLPSEFAGLKTDLDQWISMQGKGNHSKKGILTLIKAAHNLGLKVMLYNNGTPSGWFGSVWARKHPEWLLYTYTGSMLGNQLRVEDLEKMKEWHKTMKPEKDVPAFQPFLLNFYDPKLVEYGCEQILWAADNLGYDGVRFDGNWMLGDVWSGIGYSMDGHRPNKGKSIDGINSRNIRLIKQYIKRKKPDFLFGFNYGNNYECGGARNPDAYRAACRDNGMILWELCAHNGTFSNWCAGAFKLWENSMRVHQDGGIHYGQIAPSNNRYPNNDFYQRYIYITNFAAASHLIGTVYYGHPGYLPIQGLYLRFALRFGKLLYDKDLQPIKNPTAYLNITAGGKRNHNLWWMLYTYKLQAENGYYIITHLVNMPDENLRKENSTLDKQPKPIKDVLVKFSRKPEKVFILDPETVPWMTDKGSVASVRIPELKAWKIVVQKFPGSCAEIPVKRIPERDFKGKDILPDSRSGKIVIPVSTLITGAEGGNSISSSGVPGISFIEDKQAQFGHALHARKYAGGQSVKILSGPNQVMPNAAPGKTRIIWRLKVEDNTGDAPVCTVSGLFGSKEIKASDFHRPGRYQNFSYEYNIYENKANIISLCYHGTVDLWIDNPVLTELHPANDKDYFDSGILDESQSSIRSNVTGKVHVCRGLWHEFFGLNQLLKANGINVDSSWESINATHADIPKAFPITMDELMKYDLVALLNVAASSLQPIRRKNLREYVLRGGTVFIGGGPRSYGHGGYKNTFLEELLPVTIKKFDLRKAKDSTQKIIAGNDVELTGGISFAEQPVNLYYHQVEAKPGATVLLKTADGVPLLTMWKKGAGTVYAFTGTPLGESDKKCWWQWNGWHEILDRIIKATTKKGGTGRISGSAQRESTGFPLIARISGKNDLNAVDAQGRVMHPVKSNGVKPCPQGISLGYGKKKHSAPGTLLYEKGLIKPYGSITFKIKPGWKPLFSDIDQSLPLFYAQTKDGRNFNIYIYCVASQAEKKVHVLAMGMNIHSNDKGTKEFSGHSILYPITKAYGGLVGITPSIWQKGKERTITVEWSPTQLVLKENGMVMVSKDFIPAMDLSHFSSAPLYIGSSSSQLSRVILSDIIIRGKEGAISLKKRR